MSNYLVDLGGRQKFAESSIAFVADTIKSKLLDLATADTAAKIITGCTGAASPITATSNGHGFANGQLVVTGGIGGNLAANQLCRLANVTLNTFDLVTWRNSLAMTGNAPYTAGGYVVNLDLLDFLAAIDASSVGVDVILAGKSATLGVLDAAPWTHTNTVVGANPVRAFVLYKDSGAPATSPCFGFNDGKIQVEVDFAAPPGATSIVILPCPGGIPNNTVITFSNGVQATLTAPAAFNDRVLTCVALGAGIAAGHTADVTSTNSNLPSPTGGTMNIQITPDAVSGNGLFRL